MDDKFYLQLNLVNIITVFLMWLIVAVILGLAVTWFGKGKDQTEGA
jgi:hypothetical protein